MKVADSRYVEITLEDMEKFLQRAFGALHPKKGKGKGGEVVFDLSLSDNHSILVRVYSSIYVGSGMGRSKGSDSIKVVMLTDKSKPLMPAGKIVMRTTNWRTAIQDRIETYLEVYEEKVDYWKNRRLERHGEKPSGKDRALDEAVIESLPPPTPAEVREMEDAEREIREEEENSGEEAPQPPPPPVKSEPFVGEYKSLPGGGFGVVILTQGRPGEEGIGKTKGGKRTKIRLLEKKKEFNDPYNGNQPAELWTFEDVNPRPQRGPYQRWAEDGSELPEDAPPEDTLVASVIDRYLSRSAV